MAEQPLPVAVCSWSLHVDEPADIAREFARFNVEHTHLGIGGYLRRSATERRELIAALRAMPVKVASTMIGFAGENYSTLETIHHTGGYLPDDMFEDRFALTMQAAEFTHDLGVDLLTTHAGFIPDQTDAESFARMVARLRRIADGLSALGIALCFETGQETAETLAAFLAALERPNIGVNFDPANMILYGKGDPVNAAIRLASHIRQIHCKDARKRVPTPAYPQWAGDEVPAGQGVARVQEVIITLYRCGFRGPVAIECESGAQRGKWVALALTEINAAFEKLRRE
jgi:sugar phosphate isomerase/epimerase